LHQKEYYKSNYLKLHFLNYFIKYIIKTLYNYILVVGEKEKETNSVNVRIRDTREQKDLSLEDFINKVKDEKKSRLI